MDATLCTLERGPPPALAAMASWALSDCGHRGGQATYWPYDALACTRRCPSGLPEKSVVQQDSPQATRTWLRSDLVALARGLIAPQRQTWRENPWPAVRNAATSSSRWKQNAHAASGYKGSRMLTSKSRRALERKQEDPTKDRRSPTQVWQRQARSQARCTEPSCWSSMC